MYISTSHAWLCCFKHIKAKHFYIWLVSPFYTTHLFFSIAFLLSHHIDGFMIVCYHTLCTTGRTWFTKNMKSAEQDLRWKELVTLQRLASIKVIGCFFLMFYTSLFHFFQVFLIFSRWNSWNIVASAAVIVCNTPFGLAFIINISACYIQPEMVMMKLYWCSSISATTTIFFTYHYDWSNSMRNWSMFIHIKVLMLSTLMSFICGPGSSWLMLNLINACGSWSKLQLKAYEKCKVGSTPNRRMPPTSISYTNNNVDTINFLFVFPPFSLLKKKKNLWAFHDVDSFIRQQRWFLAHQEKYIW